MFSDVLQTVGDAISDLLVIELILSASDWNVEMWNHQYTDLPNRQLKIHVSSTLNQNCLWKNCRRELSTGSC